MHNSAWQLFYRFSFCLLLFAVASCDTTIKTDEAIVSDAIVEKNTTATAAQEIFAVDTAKSQITWIGAKLTGRHNGFFYVQSGQLYRSKGLLTGGTIKLNMADLRSADSHIDAENNRKLTRQLRSADFFDVERFPTAIFKLTSIAPFDSSGQKPAVASKYSELRVNNPTHRITGNLTIKGQTKSVTFPARVTFKDSILHAEANFNLDRTKWGLVYRSDESLGDKTIYPEVNISLNIFATQQTP